MERICKICGGNLKSIISETSSVYYYCENCKDGEEVSLKHALLDNILKNLNNYLKKIDIHIIDSLEISIILESKEIITKVNGILIDKLKCNYKFTAKEINHFKNSIIYVIEDNLFIDIDRISLILNLS